MNIVHAFWEQRNMGVDAYEVEIEPGDSFDDFLNSRQVFETEYTVVKVPTANYEWNSFLQDEGYKYIETMFSFSRRTDLPELTGVELRLSQNMSYAVMNEDDKEKLFEEIRSGLFTTDRISIDPYFTRTQSQERYIGFLNDEVANGGVLYNILYKDTVVGFFVLRDKGKGLFYSALGGIYANKGIPGIGFAMNYFEIVEALKLGGKRITAAVSSNNKNSFGVISKFEFSVDKITSVFIKHANR